MRRYEIEHFGADGLSLVDFDVGAPGPEEVIFAPRALSLNYRDHLVLAGTYNPRLSLPVVPVSDAAGEIVAVGAAVRGIRVGDRMLTNFVTGWSDGRFDRGHLQTTLGTPGPGLAAQQVRLATCALVPMPAGLDFASAATLPIAALTAYSVLVTEAGLQPGQTVLTLGTGGVSIFALQLAHAMGARVIVTSSSDERLARARLLGADLGINYATEPRWDKAVLAATQGRGADVVVETGGIATLPRSLQAVRPGGVVGLLGALTGLKGELDIGPIVMKRIRVAGILVDSRKQLLALLECVQRLALEPVIGQKFPFEQLPEAFAALASGGHFGKIVVEM